jgi:DNA-binding NarL/FixJ family response regulator
MKKIKVAIAEDNKLLAAAIVEKLNILGEGVEFRYRAVNGIDMLEKLQIENEIDAILMDIEMPEMDGIECTSKITELYPDIKIIMLTVFDDEEKIFNSIQAGAAGYLLKDEPSHKILEGIQMIMSGGAPMSPSIAAKALNLMKNPGNFDRKPEMNFSLSNREKDVLEKLCLGLGYQQIADELFIASGTVRKHIENIYKKLQVHNKYQAIEKVRKYNIV